MLKKVAISIEKFELEKVSDFHLGEENPKEHHNILVSLWIFIYPSSDAFVYNRVQRFI